MRRTVLSAVLACALVAGACTSAPQRDVDEGKAAMVSLGEYFDTEVGQIFVLRVQDEFRLIRCIPDGPIAGCYEDVYSISGHDVDWNSWLDVDGVPGLRVAFLSPTAIAVAHEPVVAEAASK